MGEIEDYIMKVDEKRRPAFRKLFETIAEHLPNGFQAVMQYGMPSFVVPLATYPDGYLKRKDEPLPYISIAAQKNSINLYHMGIYGDENLKEWFISRYQKEVPTKLDMGKSCIRMRNINYIPYELIGDLSEKMTVDEWIRFYENRNHNIC
ncbi:DUF1801 domain-containing protein [Staphylococcus carnosus]|uniref:YdhG-like domain-containing protein n=2 Tax=Staphylococcus carnosus TaxID=1281 RepID=B9DQ11_STACT|nr:DUF1801 domain-containing protein [Staphylococcus carnosus]KKB24377.1 hypothetical protein VV61_11650 [Staphylococcus carnosus]KOR11951.1 hypothetical protein AMC75_11320 [Staphylococcus carnosus]POA05123.1 DUF1801 domain-containing protein [Staphylococcus carnosus]QPT03794.1 DUF1801 domain-containing protein [Staphylococcus carnosus]QQS85618.1 DUF1801 domain-containing protein [Staphylococcus carnosus]